MPPAVAVIGTVFTAVGAAGAAIGGAIGGLVGLGAVGAAVGAGIATGALAGALIGGATAAITGGDIGDGLLKGAMFGALTGGVLGGIGGPVSEGITQFMETAGNKGVMSAMSETYGNIMTSMEGAVGTTGTMQGMTQKAGATAQPSIEGASVMSPEAQNVANTGFGVGTKTTTVTPQPTSTFSPNITTDFSNVGVNAEGNLGLIQPKMAATGVTGMQGGAVVTSDQGLLAFIANENKLNREFLAKQGKTAALWNAAQGFASNYAQAVASEDEKQSVSTSATPRRPSLKINQRRTGYTGYTTPNQRR